MNIRRALIALGLATGLSLGISGVAHATSYDCDGGSNPVPTNAPGDVDIVASGACTISHSVTAVGHIRIVSTGDLTVTGTLTSGLNNGYEIDLKATDISVSGSVIAGGYIRGEATSDHLSVMGNVVSNSADVTGNILLIAQKNIRTGNIVSSGNSTSGGVEIDPNQGGANTLFTIGGTGNANGVNGTIDASTVNGGGTSATNVKGGIFISNGGTNSTGGITVTNGSDLNVSASNSRAGLIILDAKKGTLTI
jgi:hypothetical protein